MKFSVIIPARMASTRLPDKPLADLGGKPMVVRVAERALESGAERIIVATDHAAIAAACAAHGVEVCMTRSDHPSGTDRIAEVARALALADDAVVVNLQGDEPLIDPALLASCAARSATRTTIGLPPRSASGLLGRRVDASRAGMMTMKSIT